MPVKVDYEYVRRGTCNLFIAIEPKGGRRTVGVTDHRTKADFVAFVRHLPEQVYATARRVHLVLDNLNPARWTGQTRNWTPVGVVTLNPERDCIANAHLEDKLIPPLTA
ncbi:MAG: transposase [Candidatus Dechloromonas phosphoritropha]|nr:transposase [Azonexus sp.]